MGCRFVVIRIDDSSVHIYPVKEKATEAEVLRMVVRPFIKFMYDNVGYDFFEDASINPKQVKREVVCQRVAEYANNNNCRFWLVTDVCDYYYVGGESEDYCVSMIPHDFYDVLRTVKRELKWSELTQDW